MPTTYNITPGTIPDCYPASANTLQINALNEATLTLNLQGTIHSVTEPASSDRDKLWIKLNAGGFPVAHYIYQGGLWVWPHAVPASGSERIIWTGSTASLQTYQGGSAGTVSDASGPFWEVDTNFEAVFPIGVGTLPSTTSLSVGDTGGLENVTLTTAQIPSHSHDFKFKLSEPSEDPSVDSFEGIFDSRVGDGDAETENTGGGESHTNMPPYRAVYFAKRTARIYYTA